MLSIYCGRDNECDRLRKHYPWLRGLTKFPPPDHERSVGHVETDFASSRSAFNNDGNLFMVVLRRYVLAERLLELFFNFVEDRKHGGRAQFLLFRLQGLEEEELAPRSDLSRNWTTLQVPFEDTFIPDDAFCDRATQIAKDRRGGGEAVTRPHSRLERGSFDNFLSQFSKRHREVNKRSADEISLSVCDAYEENPPVQWASPLWLQIGRNLSSLGELLGVTAERWQFADVGSPGIIKAFGERAKKQQVDLIQKQMLEQANIIQRQEQVITALRFRHMLENLPGPDIKGGFAGKRWTAFWGRAVQAAWETRKSPAADDPVGKLLRDEFAKIDQKKLKEEAKLQQVSELPIAKRAGDLYSVLSRLIHEYQDGKFVVNRLTYSPDDVDILNALVPSHVEDGEVIWSEERKRYERKRETDNGGDKGENGISSRLEDNGDSNGGGGVEDGGCLRREENGDSNGADVVSNALMTR
ncbi:hypothetical protein QBC34DRAFT_381684 [Podospora aff. communis PSN243]|uniref:Uncharacterized protein n=1 Tax=Podospora aff. communis PSN243 TaxID=3040156 RepID=A0AAV9GIY3_9PEZI|nr:hypothetical protein QBC34DRAFT_381684 [Podospora aff. communis PSN243]